MGNGAIAVAVDVQLDRLELNHPGAGLINQTQHREIGIARERALAGELRQSIEPRKAAPGEVLEANQFGFSDGTLAVLGRLGLLLGR